MKQLTFLVEPNDVEFINDISKTFEGNVDIQSTMSMDGISFISCVISFISLSIQIVEFVKSHLGDDEKASRRMIVTKEGSWQLVGYSADEVKKIVESILDGQS